MGNKEVNRREFLQAAALATLSATLKLNPAEASAGRHFLGSPYPYGFETGTEITDFPVFAPGFEGHFYTQTRGEEPYPRGFAVLNDDQAKMWTAFKEYGGVGVWGYPVSTRWSDAVGRICQTFQKGIFQLSTEKGLQWMNTLEEIENKKISLDKQPEFIPDSLDWSSDKGKSWGHNRWGAEPDTVEANHIDRVFASYPHLRQAYLANPLWFEQYGLPMAVKDYSDVITVRCQRTALQRWKDITPWTSYPGQVVTGNISDIPETYNLFPKEASIPVDPPASLHVSAGDFGADIIVRRGDAQKPFVYLTVDDFWDAHSALTFLNMADAKGAKITFFPVGNRVAAAPEVFREVVAGGHTIENHTQNHKWLSRLTTPEMYYEITQQRETVRAVLGDPNYQQHFMRPPGGAGIFDYDPRVPAVSQELGLRVAMWTADSNGWRIYPRTDAEAQEYVMRSIRSGLGSGSIILQHAIPPDIVVFERLIDEVRAGGLHPVSM